MPQHRTAFGVAEREAAERSAVRYMRQRALECALDTHRDHPGNNKDDAVIATAETFFQFLDKPADDEVEVDD